MVVDRQKDKVSYRGASLIKRVKWFNIPYYWKNSYGTIFLFAKLSPFNFRDRYAIFTLIFDWARKSLARGNERQAGRDLKREQQQQSGLRKDIIISVCNVYIRYISIVSSRLSQNCLSSLSKNRGTFGIDETIVQLLFRLTRVGGGLRGPWKIKRFGGNYVNLKKNRGISKEQFEKVLRICLILAYQILFFY